MSEPRRAEWAPEGKPAPEVDRRHMTKVDLFGTYAGDLLTWAREREEPWTREAAADELVSRYGIENEAELDEYKMVLVREGKAATAWVPEWKRALAGADPDLTDAIEDSRFHSALDAIEELDWSDIEAARERFEG